MRGSKLCFSIDILSRSSCQSVGLRQGNSSDSRVPRCLCLTSPIINKTPVPSSTVMQPPSIIPTRGPLGAARRPLSSALPEMPQCSEDLSTTLTGIGNQSPARCLALWVNSPQSSCYQQAD
ncbi:hypothetical protein CesoFtcFv8_003098 [Champsocephalus esox]|uniref:Uncharacterized protein n=1 Tax=Champsocephalus esox TaxID=159716 RepID=A0AAN8HBJ7_9TELE|nr:hypothetical protein CesoFtcFv8_003098 [Champsocephalus esox]